MARDVAVLGVDDPGREIGDDVLEVRPPAQGPRVVGMEELDASFAGVVLTFKPGANFQPGGSRPSIKSALIKRLIGSETGSASENGTAARLP